MKQEIIQKALEKIQNSKREAVFQYNKKIAPLYEDKEFLKLDKEYTRLVIENAKKESLNENVDKTQEEILLKKLNQIKRTSNLENVEPNYSCTICNDEGFKNGQMCKCLKKEISNFLLKESGFLKLESFDKAMQTCGTHFEYYEKMKNWCNGDFQKTFIYIAGPTGVGKTYLLQCMANELIERGKVVKITTAFKMNQDFKDFSKTFNENLLNKYLDCEILFIDDLGTEPLYKNVTLEYLYLIINERKMKKLPTIITSNLDLFDIINRYDERVTSRIIDNKTSINILLEGTDKRRKGNL